MFLSWRLLKKSKNQAKYDKKREIIGEEQDRINKLNINKMILELVDEYGERKYVK